jgi:hypothetical protein
MSAVFSRAAVSACYNLPRRLTAPQTRCLASTSASTSAPLQKRAIASTSKCARPLYFYSDHTPSTSTSGPHSPPPQAYAQPSYDHNAHNAQRIHSISGDFTQTQHAFDPPPMDESGRATAGWSFDASTRRVYRPALDEYDYMDGGAGYGLSSLKSAAVMKTK